MPCKSTGALGNRSEDNSLWLTKVVYSFDHSGVLQSVPLPYV